jgi:drug/metabolite transporter (DMT)-like permease
MSASRNVGVLAALGAALLFGVGTPAAKLLLEAASPWMLAGLLYLGSGAGLLVYRLARGARPVRLSGAETGWLAAGIASGGVLAPVLLMWGLARMPAADASLLLNAESVFTALIAWFVFKENFDRRIALGMLLIVAGAVLLSWPGQLRFGVVLPALAVVGACWLWALDNNLTRKVALVDASFIAMTKGLAAGATNVVLAWLAGAEMPVPAVVLAGALVGFASYGASLVLFVVGLRHLGAARTGAYFSTAPFAGALLALLLGDALTLQLAVAGALMAAGVWLHLTERHSHTHRHEPVEHEHAHVHDDHHRHDHSEPVPPETQHSHPHRHESLTHAHEHFPDAHHRHGH